MEKVRETVIAWRSFEGSAYVSYAVVVELRNVGTGWAQISGFNSDYTVLNASGGIVTTGSFTYEYPEFIGPGGTGYLIDESVHDGNEIDDFAVVEVSGRYNSVDGPEATLTFSDLAWRTDRFTGGLTATGFLTSDRDLRGAAVAVLCLAADGRPLGVTTTNLIKNVTAGTRKAFETVGETPKLKPSECATTVAYGQGTDF